ncbi:MULTISPECIES: beta-ketoacyl-[acyl-carrier-protein] synthase family protein [unclassified Moorena]|uniref:beta-ketoacyl-[acyl-carrier-protein] synthase family protein n=1 Tax=unclassified Moorena TaxID=2683338 RepID=UPI0013BF1D1C|nr:MULTISPECIES: beta-ketoacyl-[acyl-carrier-protein] synthase family protein [unclassified Moorena]NEO04184.1 beta-ketoacyl-[acyl-carrier-protein] synthase family protein [Moorena sp. SIO3I8]NEO21804.1 beta-ketoacyl-[acyl-carrier-protein] synthase family protein [Moorena sp. SIO4A5]NEQ57917.1 beta-ketoacyl-[acyl-carrier-protein] synthase family protein [Moorena sp. SIO4A1]
MSILSDDERVVITGLGCVSAHGVGVRPFWNQVVEGHSAIAPTTRAQAGHSITVPAAPVTEFQLQHHIKTPQQPLLDPFSQYALVAAHEAINDAAWDLTQLPRSEVAVILGSTSGGEASRENEAVRFFYQGKKRCNPALVTRTNHQAVVCGISMHFGFTGPAFVVHTGCASGTHAIAQAYLMLRHGQARYAVTGGAEACVMFSTLVAFQAMGVLATDTCRPFSSGRTGMALGEGAGVITLETLAAARERHAPIYAELAGIGMSADASDPVNPVVHGPIKAMQLALDRAGLKPKQVDYINAHGTGTQSNDQVENEAIKQLFDAHATHLAVSSTKASHGHALGASGGFELIATVLSLQEGLLPPTANFTTPDPKCDLDYIPNHSREQRISVALSNSFALGGLNAVLAVTSVR